MITDNVFWQITLIISISVLLGLLARLLRQPLILAFITVGLLVGPAGLKLSGALPQLELLATMGVALLLFLVGLSINPQLIRSVGKVSLLAGLCQLVLTAICAYLISRGLFLPPMPSLFVAIALTNSSTIIIIKILADKKEIDSLHGRITIGITVIQDIIALIILIFISTLGNIGGAEIMSSFALLTAKGVMFVVGIYVLTRYLISPLMHVLASSQELLSLFAVAWALLLAAGGDILGFSLEIGAFFAGISLASTPYRESISLRLNDLRDFLLLFFFINLGAQLSPGQLNDLVGPALILSAFVMLGKPIFSMAVMGLLGYRRHTSFMTSVSLTQISEFSLIISAMGVSFNLIDERTLALVILISLITIGFSSHLMVNAMSIYRRVFSLLGLFERSGRHLEEHGEADAAEQPADVILVGLGRYGRNIARNLHRRGKKVLAVDFNPETLKNWRAKGRPCLYGDIEDPELFSHLPLNRARWLVNTIYGRELNLNVLQLLQQNRFSGQTVLTAQNYAESVSFREAGADKVLRPHVDAAEHAVEFLNNSLDRIIRQSPWPFNLTEVRLRPDSFASGKTIGRVDLRALTGVSIVAVDRDSRSFFDLHPGFLLFPGDRLVLLGENEDLEKARIHLQQSETDAEATEDVHFAIETIEITPGSDFAGRQINELNIREKFNLNVLGILRGQLRIMPPGAEETILPGDQLLVLGERGDLLALKA